VLITAFIYLALLILDCFIYYMYLLFLHYDGRLIDIFTRVTGKKNEFFVP